MKQFITLLAGLFMISPLMSNPRDFDVQDNSYLVTFYVNMHEAVAEGEVIFDPQLHSVYISGSFSDWTMPGTDELFEMQLFSTDSLIYSISLPVPSGIHYYKYFLVEDLPTWNLGEWPGWPDRVIEVNQPKEVFDTWGLYFEQFFVFNLPLENQVFTVGEDQYVQAQIELMGNFSGYYYLNVSSGAYYSEIGSGYVTQAGIFDHYFYLNPDLPQGNYSFYLSYFLDEIYYGEITSNLFAVENDNYFLEIYQPDNYSFWFSGNGYWISWCSLNVTSVDILFSLDNGQSWERIVQDYYSSGYGCYDYYWEIPSGITELYPQSLVLIRDSDNHEIYALSSIFTIGGQPFAFLKPDEGEIFEVGNDQIIPVVVEMKYDFGVYYEILLININDGSSWAIVENSISEAGEYQHDFILPENIFPGDYVLLLWFNLQDFYASGYLYGPQITILNDNACLEVLSPYYWDTWYSGQNYYIWWRSSNIDWVNIEFSLDAGNSWNIIATWVMSNDGSNNFFDWQIPDISGSFSESLIKIESSSDSEVFALSEAFTISGIPVKILHPDSQTVLVAGDELPIVIDVMQEAYVYMYICDDQDYYWIGELYATEGILTYSYYNTLWLTPGYYRIYLYLYNYPEGIFSEYFSVLPSGTSFPVTFNLDMSNVDNFDPETHHVYVTGNFSNWAVPGTDDSAELFLSDPEAAIYSVTRQIAPGTCSYKYFSDAFGQGWQGGEWQGNPNREVFINSTISINDIWGAHQQVFFDLMLLADPSDGGIVNGAGIFNAGQLIQLTALANTDFSFICWNNTSGVTICVDPDFEYLMPATNVTLTALFEYGVGVGDELTRDKIRVFPNPSSLNLNIVSERMIKEIEITDITSKTIFNQVIMSNEITIPVADFHPGMYFVKVMTETEIALKKIIVQ